MKKDFFEKTLESREERIYISKKRRRLMYTTTKKKKEEEEEEEDKEAREEEEGISFSLTFDFRQKNEKEER